MFCCVSITTVMEKVPYLRTSPNPEAKPDEDHNEIDESANEKNVEPLNSPREASSDAKCSSEEPNEDKVDTCESKSDGVTEPHVDHDEGQDSPNQEKKPDTESEPAEAGQPGPESPAEGQPDPDTDLEPPQRTVRQQPPDTESEQPQNLHLSPEAEAGAEHPLNLHQSPTSEPPDHCSDPPHPFHRPASYHPGLDSGYPGVYPAYNHHYFNNANNNYNNSSFPGPGFPPPGPGGPDGHEMYMAAAAGRAAHLDSHSSHLPHPGLAHLGHFSRMAGAAADPYSFPTSDDEMCSPTRGANPLSMGFSGMPMPLIAPKAQKPRKPRKPKSPKPDGILSMQMKEDSRRYK